MDIRPGTVERAFDLAENSRLLTVEQIRRRLKAEGYGDWEFQLSGKGIRRQLRALVAAKRKKLAAALAMPRAEEEQRAASTKFHALDTSRF